MKLDLKYVWAEKLPSGNLRYRFKYRKEPTVTLKGKPGSPEFHEHYKALLEGRDWQPAERKHVKDSLGWLVSKYLTYLSKMVDDGLASTLTLRQRQSHLNRLKEFHVFDAEMPRKQVIKIRDGMSATPGAADNMVKSIRALYKWALEMELVERNPAVAIPKINRSKGFTAWTVQDLWRFRETHPPGTMAHLALTVFIFTAARISDACRFGRANETIINGETWLSWYQWKGGEKQIVEIPMLPPLLKAVRAPVVEGKSYILTEFGKPFSTGGLGSKMREWCDEAGLGLSSHGIRKASGALLAEMGCSQYEIMAVQGHATPKSSEVYTRSASRRVLAASAMKKLGGMEW